MYETVVGRLSAEETFNDRRNDDECLSVLCESILRL